ncbi:MAG: hypothetical protein JWM18_1584 [Chloroflexi bacterium]|jgi:hypothetical protein|nr:hypothetical protein [Chloroflexota bacterium]
MDRRARAATWMAALMAVLFSSTPVAAAPMANEPVAAGQHFLGVVNDRHGRAVVDVVCSGTGAPGETGPPAGGQTLGLDKGGGGGTTGDAAMQVVARFHEDSSASVVLRGYGVDEGMPMSLSLPCSGGGTVAFTPDPDSPTAKPDLVHVTYVDIAR